MRRAPSRWRSALLAVASASAATAAAPAARADACEVRNGLSPCIDAQGLWVHPGPGRFVAIGPGTTTPEGQAAFGMLVTYMSRPIGLRVGSADPDGLVTYLVDDAVDATYWAAIGVLDRLELSVAAPETFFQSGAGLGAVLGTGEQLARTTVRDPRLGVAYALLPRPRAGNDDGLSLVARGELAIPLGDEAGFARASTVTFAPSGAAEWRRDRLTVGGEVIGRIRGVSPFADVVWGTQVGGGLGATVLVWDDARMRVGGEAFTLVDVDSQPRGEPLMPAEWMVHVSSAPLLGGDVSFLAGGGGPIPWTGEAALGTPRMRFELGVRYAPEGRDTDGDGVLDRDDRCAEALEDQDGFQDQDGCPDPDNDADGTPDAQDRCPTAAEDRDGFEDDDGCPEADDDRDGVLDGDDKCPREAETIDGNADGDGCPEPGATTKPRWQGNQVVIDGLAKFAPASDAPTPALEGQLRMLAQLARTRAPLQVVIVEAWADRSSDASAPAQDLAARRAEAARRILAAAGIPVATITAAAGDPGLKRPVNAPQLEITVQESRESGPPKSPGGRE